MAIPIFLTFQLLRTLLAFAIRETNKTMISIFDNEWMNPFQAESSLHQ
jgi:hypothetical protein